MIHRYFNAYLLYPLLERLQRRRIRSVLREIRREASLDFPCRRQRAIRRLVRTLQHAGHTVPYYRDLFQKIRFDPASVQSDLKFLRKIPLLTKAIIRREQDRLLSTDFSKATLHERKTGGSTGPSTMIYYSQESLDTTAAVNQLVLEWCGKKPHMKEIHLASRFPESFPLKDRFREWVKCASMNRTNIFTDSLDDEELARVFHRLRRVRPHLVQCHPSTFYALACYLQRIGQTADGILDVFESTGESLDAKKREAVERVFGCSVVNRYGSAEFGVVAYELLNDKRHWLRVLDNIVWPETVSINDDVPELVLTGLANPAMPLIRYRTGDLAELSEDSNGFHLRGILGRVHQMVHIGEKQYPTHYFQDLLDRVNGVEEFQLEERRNGRPLLRIVTRDEASRRLVAESTQRWWNGKVEVAFVGFDDLKRMGSRSKFQYVVPEDRCDAERARATRTAGRTEAAALESSAEGVRR